MTEISFKNQAGQTLVGRLEFPGPRDQAFPAVVMAHGYDSSKESPRGRAVAEGLRRNGIATLLFDFSGHGGSEGSKAESSIEQQVGDLRAAVDFITGVAEVDPEMIGVTGASSGGLVALSEALTDPRVKALVLRGPRIDGMSEAAPRFRLPILIIQGESDPLLPVSQAFFSNLRCRKAMKIIHQADHLFSGPGQMRIVVDLTAAWFRNVFPMTQREAA